MTTDAKSTNAKSSKSKKRNEFPPSVMIPASLTLGDFYSDDQCMVLLTDGRYLVGKLTTHDIYGNLILEDCFERIFINSTFADDSTSQKKNLIIPLADVVFVSDLTENKALRKIDFAQAEKLKKEKRDESLTKIKYLLSNPIDNKFIEMDFNDRHTRYSYFDTDD